MKKDAIKLPLLLILVLAGCILWLVPAPTGLDIKAWHIFIVFIITIMGILSSVMPMGAITLFFYRSPSAY